ncbi:hypothetical protein POVCU2_0045750, partial [Plasmodium ovale curtisi]
MVHIKSKYDKRTSLNGNKGASDATSQWDVNEIAYLNARGRGKHKGK